MVLLVIAVAMALVVSGICSLMEASLLSTAPSDIAELSMKNRKVGQIWQDFKTSIERPIAFILILNTAAHTVGATLAGAQFEKIFGDEGIWIFSLIFTFIMLQFTEILPKTLGVRYNLKVAWAMTWPLATAVKLTLPLIHLVHWINRPFEGKRKKKPTAVQEILSLLGMARYSRELGSMEEQVIRGASELQNTQVYQIMLPVEQVKFLSAEMSLEQALAEAAKDLHTRFPVMAGNDRNHLLGYVNFKQMASYREKHPHAQSLGELILPLHFVSPQERLAEQLRVFIQRRIHIAMVKEKDGRIAGLVTLEDILEELVGEVEDEFDPHPPDHLRRQQDGSWICGGGVSVPRLARKLGVKLSDPQEDLSTWLEQQLGQRPGPGARYREAGFEFIVQRMRRGQPYEILLRRLE